MATKKQTTAVVTWEDELSKEAEIAAAMEANSGGGQFFSVKGGALTWQDAPLPDNHMGVIILDSIFENVYYEGPYDPDTPQSPTCFAFGRVDKEMAPHKIVFENGTAQNPTCADCQWNEFGTAHVGRGKACRNTRRLGMIPAGTYVNGKFQLIEDPQHFETAAVGYMKLPVTSVKGYASFVKQVAGALKRPPFGIATRVHVVPDSKNQFKVVFEPIMNVPNELAAVIMKRRDEVRSIIDFPYTPFEEDEAPRPQASRAAKRPPARNRKY